MVRIIIVLTLLALSLSAPSQDRMTFVPGYPSTFRTSVYSGYLDLGSPNRQAHYVFVESINGASNKDPVTLWLNGGPGCSSLLGFLQQIGPYYLEDGRNYAAGDLLTENKYSWHKVSNLLFLESPAGVGFSYNLDTKFQYTDGQTADDNMKAILSFFAKFRQYLPNGFWLAGQSYAGKYIPDLAVLIDKQNSREGGQRLNFKGFLVGNGVMTFEHLEENRVQFLITRSFIDPELVAIYRHSCSQDPQSAGCQYAKIRISEDTQELNPYNVFGYCYYNDSFDATIRPHEKPYLSQEGILLNYRKDGSKGNYNGAPCAYFDGMFNYFNIHAKEYHAKFTGQTWNGPCAQNITYLIDPAGSMESYRYMLTSQRKYSMQLYSGDWDAVVPYLDTIAGIKALNLVESYINQAWFTDDQHSGFEQLYSGILFTTFKGASHQVPQSRRAESLQYFNVTLEGNKNAFTLFEERKNAQLGKFAAK